MGKSQVLSWENGDLGLSLSCETWWGQLEAKNSKGICVQQVP